MGRAGYSLGGLRGEARGGIKCGICGGAGGKWAKRYCLRCRRLLKRSGDAKAAYVAALQKAWSVGDDGFLCHYSGVKLVEGGRKDPWALSFDHVVPGQKGNLVVCSFLINVMKAELSEEEFRVVVKEIDRHWKGQRFRKDVIGFASWNKAALAARGRIRRALAITGARGNLGMPGRLGKPGARGVKGPCPICGAEAKKGTRYCARCFRLQELRGERVAARKALKRAWDAKAGGFRCHYTGIILEEKDRKSPWYISFDHPTPGKKGAVVVTAIFVNLMKTDMSEKEFRAMIRELAKKFKGGVFDKSKLEFKYYHRGVRPKTKK